MHGTQYCHVIQKRYKGKAMTAMPTEDFLKNVDSLYSNAERMHEILGEILDTIAELVFFGPVATDYVQNIKSQRALINLAMTYASDAHELERRNDRENAMMCVNHYNQILETIIKLDKKLDEMRKNNG
jgi:hypothetical protein